MTFKCSGGKILAIDDLPHEVFVQQISLQGALKTLIIFLKYESVEIVISINKSRIRSFSIRAKKLANCF